MKVLLTDGVREVKLLVEGDLEEFSRFQLPGALPEILYCMTA